MKKLNKKQKGKSKPKIVEGSYSFVIGNGTSRRDFNLQKIQPYGTLIACNWFFRDEFRPDILVASDEPMSKTIQKVYDQYPKNNHFYTWFPKPGTGSKKPNTPEKFSAGGLGTHIAVDIVKSKKVFLIGMDFFGFGSKNKMDNGGLNNLYANKKHYVKVEEGAEGYAPTYRNWQRRFEWIIKSYPDTDFYHVDPFEGKSPERLRGYQNFHQITWENLNEHIFNDAELTDILEKTQEDIDLIKQENEDNIRASIERQLAGQENRCYPDLLHPKQVYDVRKKGQEEYKRSGMDGQVVINIHGFDIMIPPQIVSEGNIARLATDKEFDFLFTKEYNERYRGDLASLKIWDQVSHKPEKASKPNLVPPPPPPGMSGVRTPPPPPPTTGSRPSGLSNLPQPPPPKAPPVAVKGS